MACCCPSWSLPTLVLLQMLVDTAGCLGAFMMVYRMVVTNYGDAAALGHTGQSEYVDMHFPVHRALMLKYDCSRLAVTSSVNYDCLDCSCNSHFFGGSSAPLRQEMVDHIYIICSMYSQRDSALTNSVTLCMSSDRLTGSMSAKLACGIWVFVVYATQDVVFGRRSKFENTPRRPMTA